MTSADAANAHDRAARHRPTTERDFCQKSAAIREIGVVEIAGIEHNIARDIAHNIAHNIARDIARGQIGAQAFKRDDFASADPRQCTARVLRTMPAKRDEKRHDATVHALCGRCCARIARD